MMPPRQFVWLFCLISMVVLAVVLFVLSRRQLPLASDTINIPSEVSPSKNQSSRSLKKHVRTGGESSVLAPSVARTSESVFHSPSDFRRSKGDRIAALHAQLQKQGISVNGPIPEEIEIMTEGMNTLSAAKYLKEVSIYNYATEYARKAVAENPTSIEPLLLLAELLDPIEQVTEIEDAYYSALEIDPDSTKALVGLGQTYSWGDRPWEAIPYLELALEADSSSVDAYRALGISYERSGRYEEALVAYRKAYEIVPDEIATLHIRLIEEGNPFFPPVPSSINEQSPGKRIAIEDHREKYKLKE